MKAEKGSWEKKLVADRGWFTKFKEKSHLCNTKVQDEVVSTDVEVAASYPENLAKMTNESGSTKQQIILVDKTGPYGKKMSSGIFKAREEKSVPGS